MDRKRRLQAVLCFFGIAVFLTEPSAAQEGVRKALQLCGGLLILIKLDEITTVTSNCK